MSIEPKHELFADVERQRHLQTITDLRAARDLVAKGWCQKASWELRPRFLFGRRMHYCLMGAIGRSCGHDWDRAIEMVNVVFAVVFPGYRMTEFEERTELLQRWNDGPRTTKAHVVDAFTRAIIHLTAA